MKMRLFWFGLFLFPMVVLAADLEPIGWGVVASMTTPFYDKTGKELAAITGGETFMVLREVKMNKAPAYYIQLDRSKKPKGIVAASDCRYFPGPIPTTDDVNALVTFVGNQKLCKDYFSLCANRDRLVARKREQHLLKSPAKRLISLKAELAQVPAKERQYEAAQKKATTNAQRLKYQDLRKELRYQTTGLQQEIKRLEAEAKAWEEKHPFDDSEVKKMPVWRRLNAQAEKLRPQVDALCNELAAPAIKSQEAL
ncbi:MAG: hypothetical protein IJV69_04790 [Kiritimatiellae bacterium]|nr:hypothetical protein [Kiritimatiellia bacterium]